MIKCDQEQSLKSLAELYREQRRPRSRMEENTHCDMEGLARTRRSDRCERRCKITVDVVAGEKTGLEFDGVCHGCCWEMESRWKADGVFMVKLDLSDEVIVGGEKMRIADDIVRSSAAISTCVKEPKSLTAMALFKKTDQCSMFKDQIVFSTTISACDKSMFWTVSHLLCQVQDTELRKNCCYYSVAITASGKASHWNIALKLQKEEKLSAFSRYCCSL